MKILVKNIASKAFPRVLDYRRIRYGFKSHLGYSPNILWPKTFSEKIQRRKLFDRDPRLPRYADKIEAKDFVARKFGLEWVTPTLWHGDRVPETIPNWPLPFVIKASHGSGMNKFVRTQEEAGWAEIKSLCERWLSNRHYGSWSGEWLYSQIQPRLLIEPFIGELAELPIDYKLWVFAGRVEFIQVDTDRETEHKRVIFDRNWNKLPVAIEFPQDASEIKRPDSLSEMIAAAEVLADDISFVRVDLYEIAHKPRFGEMTFYPESGWARIEPHQFDVDLGKLLRE